jgi:hypothetical protein
MTSTVSWGFAVTNILVAWLGREARTVVFAILSGVIGFLAKSLYDLWLATRKKLERSNQQIKLLLWPFLCFEPRNLVWPRCRRRVRPARHIFGTEPPPNTQELGQ